ncbi:MAG: hypothetical protein AB3N16_15790 [Flavobacteriaceae bacterium]
MIKVIQIGLGPLGIQIAKYIQEKEGVETIAGIDIDPHISGKTLHDLDTELSKEVKVFPSLGDAIEGLDQTPDAAIVTTVSSLKKLIPQIEQLANKGISVVSTCEELAYPWDTEPVLSQELDQLCKKNNIACLGTGVNPGFLMDYLPSVLSSVCKNVDEIIVERVQDASARRIPFQKKIGAGLDLKAFRDKEKEGSLRHVGLSESVYLLAKALDLKLDEVTESLEPIVAETPFKSDAMSIDQGNARGVEQISIGYFKGERKLKMHFRAALGEPRSFDRITIKGTPSFVSEIDGGVNGDIATCAVTINCLKNIVKIPSGLHTMIDTPVPGYFA